MKVRIYREKLGSIWSLDVMWEKWEKELLMEFGHSRNFPQKWQGPDDGPFYSMEIVQNLWFDLKGLRLWGTEDYSLEQVVKFVRKAILDQFAEYIDNLVAFREGVSEREFVSTYGIDMEMGKWNFVR